MSNRWSPTLLALALLVAGCGTSVVEEDPRPLEQRNKEPDALDETVFVDGERVRELRGQGATLIDVRSESEYESGHVPGAIHSPGGSQFKRDNGMIWQNVVKLQNLAQDLGIERDTHVVVYGKPVSKRASRLMWTLEYLGHGKVSIYQPGHEQLLDALETGAASGVVEPDESEFVVSRRASIYATGQEVKAIVEGDREGVLIDNRRRAEYEGTEERGDPRHGYIPGAKYYHWKDLFDENGDLKSKETLRSELESEGLLEEEMTLVPYCQSGTRSTYQYAVLRWLGHEDVQNYDGSWIQWSRDESAPVEKPEEG